MSMAISESESKIGSVVALAKELDSVVKQAAVEGRSLDETERDVFSRVLNIGHAAVEQLLALQGDGDLGEAVTTEQGVTLQRSEKPVKRPLRTVFGEHVIKAFVYAPGAKKKIALRPVDARLGLSPHRCSYLFEEFSQFFCVEQAFGQAARALEQVLRQKISVDTLENINRRMGEQAVAFLDDLPTPPAEEEGELLVVTADGKGVPLVKNDAQKTPWFDQPERPGNRRIATLACVYSVDRHVRTPEQIVAALFRDDEGEKPKDRPRPQFKHVTARFPQRYEDADEVHASTGPIEAFCWADAQVACRRRDGQTVLRMMDGQKSLWETADLCLDTPAESTVDILDILHAASYVWRAAKVFHTHFEHREAFTRDRLLRILQGNVRGVISGLRKMATLRGLAGQACKEIRTICGYFTANAHRMRYDEYLAAGYPIATGVIEGACRHLVKDRMERSGMRWRLESAQQMLHVRAVYQSSYWDEFQLTRIQQLQTSLHPHRALLGNYHPAPLTG